jgi:hypothetical protein
MSSATHLGSSIRLQLRSIDGNNGNHGINENNGSIIEVRARLIYQINTFIQLVTSAIV